MSHYYWNLKHQTQEQIKFVEDGQASRSSHMLNPSNLVSNHELAELTWRSGQLAIQGLDGILPTASTIKPRWGSTGDTLESIVHQATCPQNFNLLQHDPCHPTPTNMSSIAASSGRNRTESFGRMPVTIVPKKRTPSSSDRCEEIPSAGFQEDGSACASASATFCRDDDDTTKVTWASHDSPLSMRAKTIAFASHDDRQTRSETGRSHATRRIRTSAIHNLSERRRRGRINQKMEALQKLVPNASKTDKASVLDEVIEYLKQLQAQVEMMSMRSMAVQMMMQQQQQQLQMSVLAQMGIRMGIGMPDCINSSVRNPLPVTAPTFVALPPVIPTCFQAAARANSDASSSGLIPLPDPDCAFVTQSMNMELYNKMAALYRPQINQTTQTSSNPSRSNNVQTGLRLKRKA